jgi:hypothetical protein
MRYEKPLATAVGRAAVSVQGVTGMASKGSGVCGDGGSTTTSSTGAYEIDE